LNASRGTLLASDARRAVTPRERRRGLMGREGMKRGEALVIPRCRQVHTFGMNFPIDVVFVDRRGVVVRSCSRLNRRRVSPYVYRARDAVELPAGTIEQTGTEPGDRITGGELPSVRP